MFDLYIKNVYRGNWYQLKMALMLFYDLLHFEIKSTFIMFA
jgi:hypothetical protein